MVIVQPIIWMWMRACYVMPADISFKQAGSAAEFALRWSGQASFVLGLCAARAGGRLICPVTR